MKADEKLIEDLVEAIESQVGAYVDGWGGESVYVNWDPIYEGPEQVLANVLRALYSWCERWLEDPRHDALRARGDPKWTTVDALQASLLHAMKLAEKESGTSGGFGHRRR